MKNKRLLLPVLAAALAVAAGASAFAATSAPSKRSVAPSATPQGLQPQPRPLRRVDAVLVRRLRRTVWHWQAVIGLRRAYSVAPLHTARALRYWRRQARSVRRLAAHPPHRRGWLCIHRHEASWRDDGDPYWGGLQMNQGFMRTYAPRSLLRRGWANRWSPLEQMWVAERAHRSGRGYWPWPNSARYCGLL